MAHVVIDAAVDTEWVQGMIPEFDKLKADDGIVDPDEFSGNYVALYDQPRSCWTFEMDVRPWREAC